MKRIVLALTFAAALAAGGLAMTSKAEARHDCYDDYGWYGYRSYPVYYSDWGYYPRYYHSYYPRYYDRHYGHGHHGHHHDHHSGLRFSIGF
jgi:hypothetical protein